VSAAVSGSASTAKVGAELSLPSYAVMPSAQLFTGAREASISIGSAPTAPPAYSDVDPSTQSRPVAEQLGPERTLKSAQTAQGAASPVSVAAYDAAPVTLPTPQFHAVETAPVSRGPMSAPISRGPMSAPVVSIVEPSPPPPPTGLDKNVLIAILIGVIFMLLGIGITLAIALRHSSPAAQTEAPAPTDVADPGPVDTSSIGGPKGAPTVKKPAIAPAQPAGPPGKGKGKGHN
jgi:hypothetical protein